MSKNKRGVSRPGAGHFPLSPTGHFLSLAKDELFRAPARGAFFFLPPTGYFLSLAKEELFRAPARVTFLCLRRVTFFPWRKKVTKERHLRKGGFRFPPFLKNLFPLKRPKGRGCDPSLFGNTLRGFGRLSNRAFAAKRQR